MGHLDVVLLLLDRGSHFAAAVQYAAAAGQVPVVQALANRGAALDVAELSVTLRESGGERRTRRLERSLAESAAEPGPWTIDVEGWDGARASVQAWARGYLPAIERFTVRAGEGGTVRLEPGTAVSGRVLDRSGQPAGGARVVLSRVDEAGARTVLSSGQSDAGGRFRIGTGTGGSCELVAELRQVGRSLPLRRELAPRGEWDAGDLHLHGTGELAGRVVFPGGEPVAELGLEAELLDGEPLQGIRSARLATDTGGRFLFQGLTEGVFQLKHGEVEVPEFGAAGRARTGGPELELVLRAARLTVRAVDGEGRPVPFFSASVRDVDAAEDLFASHAGSAQDSMDFLVPTGRPLAVRAEDGEDRHYEGEVELLDGETERELVLRAPAPEGLASLELLLTGPDGDAILDYTALLRRSESLSPAFLDAPEELEEGAFRGLQPGLHELEVWFAGVAPWKSDLYLPGSPREIVLDAGRVTRVEWTASRGGRLELDLTDTAPLHDGHEAEVGGRPAALAEGAFERLHVYQRSENSVTTSVRAELGSVWTTKDPLPPGSWILRVTAGGYRPWEEVVLVQGGEVTAVRVAMELE